MPVRSEKGETWSISNKHIYLDPRKLMKVHTMLKPSLSNTHILGTTTEMSLTGRFYLHYWSFVLWVFKKCFCILIVFDIDFLNDVRWNTSSVSNDFDVNEYETGEPWAALRLCHEEECHIVLSRSFFWDIKLKNKLHFCCFVPSHGFRVQMTTAFLTKPPKRQK